MIKCAAMSHRRTPNAPDTPGLESLEAAHSEAQPLAIPPGARVRVDFDAPVDTTNLVNNSRYSDELAGLAAAELEGDDEIPVDPLTQFAVDYAAYAGYTMRITRLADPAARRIPGQTYNRQCLEVESLGDTPFDPTNLQGTLQLINGNSGGVFRLWIIGEDSKPVGYLPRVVIGDPPKSFNPITPATVYQQPPAPTKPEPTEFELQMQDLQRRLLSNALNRLMEPPPSVAPPQSTLSDEQKLTLMLAERGAILPGVVENLAKLASAGDNVNKAQSWTEWLQETGGRLLETHPEIGERIMNTASNLVALFINRFPGGSPIGNPTPQQPYTGGRVEPLAPQRLRAVAPRRPAPVASVTNLPEVPDPDDDIEVDSPLDREQEIENATMIVLEDLIALLSGTEPLRADHPVFVKLNTEHPAVFQQAIAMIAQYPLDPIIAWVKSKSPLYASLLDGEVTGPHLHNRLQELKTLVTQTTKANAEAQAQQTNTHTSPAS